MTNQPVLQVDNLKTYFYLEDDRVARAVDDVSFTIYPGETVALVGESGSGKSMTGLSVMRLIAQPGKIVDGSITMNNLDLLSLRDREIISIRGNDIAMIFQEPMTALNPVFTIGNQITEVVRKHKKLSKQAARQKAIDLLKMVGIPRAEEIMNEYPHQLSGGMRQRVMIAIAISCEPKLLIADEPTTALDVTIQAQILELLEELKRELKMGLLLITHDLGVVYEYADRVMVMYGGQIVEHAPTKELLKLTKHPYTEGLLASIPNLDEEVDRLGTIKGVVPPAYQFPQGCRFSDRCPHVMDKCKESNPELTKITQDHDVRCYLYEKGGNDK
ncbi:ABC transporter ATP-binding protein [Pseudogracilibacillus auburnensis]|uniref:Peptide/nickel transport system ATP-binding protein n=1 Tax=Pseudogracilibacillus auburnensis TaxID=1494959 RepID=A0A2V3WGN9_9BACI|nr:ABC transporter ATP-binding protein [Pseudogracilibacillus auburnensis]PXW87979.1 peptide/nickel transport system ATP-binding protein [Pseudogracilibacillus auburnensis]